jgi:hypothetical protein
VVRFSGRGRCADKAGRAAAGTLVGAVPMLVYAAADLVFRVAQLEPPDPVSVQMSSSTPRLMMLPLTRRLLNVCPAGVSAQCLAVSLCV